MAEGTRKNDGTPPQTTAKKEEEKQERAEAAKTGGAGGGGKGVIKEKLELLELRSEVVQDPDQRKKRVVEAVQKYKQTNTTQRQQQDEEEEEEEYDDEQPVEKQEQFSVPPVGVLEEKRSTGGAAAGGGGICRICHENDSEETLLSPCHCKGSLSLVHRSCLERWLAESDSSLCELCGFIYRTKRLPKYRLVPSMWAWLRSAETRRERRALMYDTILCCAFTPFAVIGSYLGLVLGESLYFAELELEPGMGNLAGRVATVSVVSLMTTLDLAFLSWLVVRLQYHISHWYSWYRRKCKVSLLSPQPPPESTPTDNHPSPADNQPTTDPSS